MSKKSLSLAQIRQLHAAGIHMNYGHGPSPFDDTGGEGMWKGGGIKTISAGGHMGLPVSAPAEHLAPLIGGAKSTLRNPIIGAHMMKSPGFAEGGEVESKISIPKSYDPENGQPDEHPIYVTNREEEIIRHALGHDGRETEYGVRSYTDPSQSWGGDLSGTATSGNWNGSGSQPSSGGWGSSNNVSSSAGSGFSSSGSSPGGWGTGNNINSNAGSGFSSSGGFDGTGSSGVGGGHNDRTSSSGSDSASSRSSDGHNFSFSPGNDQTHIGQQQSYSSSKGDSTNTTANWNPLSDYNYSSGLAPHPQVTSIQQTYPGKGDSTNTTADWYSPSQGYLGQSPQSPLASAGSVAGLMTMAANAYADKHKDDVHVSDVPMLPAPFNTTSVAEGPMTYDYGNTQSPYENPASTKAQRMLALGYKDYPSGYPQSETASLTQGDPVKGPYNVMGGSPLGAQAFMGGATQGGPTIEAASSPPESQHVDAITGIVNRLINDPRALNNYHPNGPEVPLGGAGYTPWGTDPVAHPTGYKTRGLSVGDGIPSVTNDGSDTIYTDHSNTMPPTADAPAPVYGNQNMQQSPYTSGGDSTPSFDPHQGRWLNSVQQNSPDAVTGVGGGMGMTAFGDQGAYGTTSQGAAIGDYNHTTGGPWRNSTDVAQNNYGPPAQPDYNPLAGIPGYSIAPAGGGVTNSGPHSQPRASANAMDHDNGTADYIQSILGGGGDPIAALRGDSPTGPVGVNPHSARQPEGPVDPLGPIGRKVISALLQAPGAGNGLTAFLNWPHHQTAEDLAGEYPGQSYDDIGRGHGNRNDNPLSSALPPPGHPPKKLPPQIVSDPGPSTPLFKYTPPSNYLTYGMGPEQQMITYGGQPY